MRTLCLVGCCKTKLTHAAPAKDLYCSVLFQLCRRWAEHHADAWAILSARYGVVEPDGVIEPYDTTIRERRPFGQPPLSAKDFSVWLYAQVQAWFSRYATRAQSPQLMILAGKEYWSYLAERPLKFAVPLDGLGIGERIQWLKEHTTASLDTRNTRPAPPSLFPDYFKP